MTQHPTPSRRRIVPTLSLIALLLCPLAHGQADAKTDATGGELDQLLQRVQTDPANTAEADVLRLIELAPPAGKTYAATVAVKGYLAFNAQPSPRLLSQAARLAELAGDYRGAVARYKSLLDVAPDDAGAGEDMGRLLTLLVDVLGAPEDAYGILRKHPAKFRRHPLATRYDTWFMDQAFRRKDHVSAAEQLAAIMARKMPLELERLHFWGHLEQLLADLSRGDQDQFAALPATKRIVGLIREDKAMATWAGLVAANLEYKASAAGKDEASRATAYSRVIAAAKAAFDAEPTLARTQEIYQVFYGGTGRWDTGGAEPRMPMIGEFFEHVFGKMDAGNRRALISWKLHGRDPVVRHLADESAWERVGRSDPGFFKSAPESASIPFPTTFDSLEGYREAAVFLDGVASAQAAIVNAMAAAAGKQGAEAWDAAVNRLITRELWHLDGDGAVHGMIRGELYDRRFRGKPWAKGFEDADYHRSIQRVGEQVLVKSPAIMNSHFARDYLAAQWRIAGEKDPTYRPMIAVLESVQWVPWDERTRRDAFHHAFREFRNWANDIRRKVKRKEEVPQAVIDAIGPIEEAFRKVMSAEDGNPAAAPNSLMRAFAEATIAIRKQDARQYNEAGKQLYAQLAGGKHRSVPLGRWLVTWLAGDQRGVDGSEVQLVVLADQLNQWKPGADNTLPDEVASLVIDRRREWHGGNTIPQGEKDRARKVNELLEKVMLAHLGRGWFSRELFHQFLKTRGGRGWSEPAWGEAVMRKIIEKDAFRGVDYRSWFTGSANSNTVAMMHLVRSGFPGLAREFPVATWFDDRFVDEAKRTGFLDYRYWDLGRDEQKKVVNGAAEILGGFERLPLGYGNGGPEYTLAALNDWQAKALEAEPAKAEAMIKTIESRYGKTRFDDLAMGMSWFLGRGKLATPDERKAFFDRLAEIISRAAAQPDRVGLPKLDALASIKAESLTDAELDVLVSIFPAATPADWQRGWGFESLLTLVQDGLLARNRTRELASIVPHLWAIARDTEQYDVARQLTDQAIALAADTDPARREMALVYATGGLDVMRGRLAEDLRTALNTQRNQSLTDVASVIPVPKTDPRYPIFESQAAYLVGREQAAWEIYLANAEILPTMIKDLDPGYCIWVVRRNTASARFDRAEELGKRLLLWFDEAATAFDPQVRGSMMLAYADIAREQGEHDVARAYYERIATTTEFEGTRAQQHAMLQVADVDRITGRYDEAVDRLEKLSRKDDTYLQTESLYYLARVRYDQGQYKEALEDLGKVFAREPEHANARILEGRVRIAVKDIENVTDIAIGDTALQRLVVPGKPLKVSLEDPNLAVVGSSADVEIRVWTESGDEEFFSLLPFGDSKTKFRGEINTELAPVATGDGTLQILGRDTVRYDFSDKFKKQNNIGVTAPPALTVASDAELYASSGRILSREELERERLDAMIRQRIGEREEEQTDVVPLAQVRSAKNVRPGNLINVRLYDADRSVTAGKDETTVQVVAESGDAIGSFVLTETETHSGVFEGAVPTEPSQATAYATDSADGSEPNYAIAPGDYPAWSAAPDGKRPKTFGIDLNDNVAMKEMVVRADVPGQKIKAFTVNLGIRRDHQGLPVIGSYPEAFEPWDGSMIRQISVAAQPKAKGDQPVDVAAIVQSLNRPNQKGEAAPPPRETKVSSLSDPVSDKELEGIKVEDGEVMVVHTRAAFFQVSRQLRTLKLVDKNPAAGAVLAFEVTPVDEVSTPGIMDGLTYKASFGRGVYMVDVYAVVSKGQRPQVELQWDIPEPPYMVPVPDEVFSIEAHPEIREAIYAPPATITALEDGKAFKVVFDASHSGRFLELEILDHEGSAPAISKINLTDQAGEQVLPTPDDFLELRRNQILEIVPGDSIVIRYIDPVTSTPGKDQHAQQLTATYANATLVASGASYSVARDGTQQASYAQMARFVPGDVVHVNISDADLDASEDLDVAVFSVRMRDTEPIELQAVETQPHSGVFVGKVFPIDGEPKRPSEIQVRGSDELIISYVDRENTNPGVPIRLDTRVVQAIYGDPEVRLLSVLSRELTDDEKMALEMNDGQDPAPEDLIEETIPVRRGLTVVRPEQPGLEEPGSVVIGTPVFVEVLFPYAARTSASRLEMFAQTQSGRDAMPAPKAAPAEKAPPPPPFDINVPGTIRLTAGPSAIDWPDDATPPGYLDDVLVVEDPLATSPLEDGRFTFAIRPAMGDTPNRSFAVEKVGDAQSNPVTTLSVLGDDTIYVGFRYTDGQGQERWVTGSAELTSDAFFDVMDRKYLEPVDGLFVGQTAYMRVIDPARNASGEKDTIEVDVTASSGTGRKVELTETFAHSGVFKGLVTLVYADEAVSPGPSEMPVAYGDDVSLAYVPSTSSQKRIEHAFMVFKGSDGFVFPFTKRFADPEMAVQTQFTIAEAHFELAKRYRELGQETEARRSIAQGKKLLEEAVRDHPDTKARAQADYLLANLSIEFAKEAVNPEAARKLYIEAIGRFSEIVTKYADSEYAPKAQYKKAQSYEKMGEIDKACEEYVKLSYRYPEHELVAETIARLGQYFLTKGRGMRDEAKAVAEGGDRIKGEEILIQASEMFKTAAEVFGRLAVRFPNHQLADSTTVLSAQCYMQAEEYEDAVRTFGKVIENPEADKDVKAEAMYWAGDSYTKMGDGKDPEAISKAYRMFKNLTWDFPESKWAKFARGRLTEKAFARIKD